MFKGMINHQYIELPGCQLSNLTLLSVLVVILPIIKVTERLNETTSIYQIQDVFSCLTTFTMYLFVPFGMLCCAS